MEIVRKESHMNIIDVFFYKLENFINPRCCKRDFSPYSYKEDESDLYLISVEKENGDFHPLTRWHELFPKGKVDKVIHSLGFSNNDCYAIKLMLSRLGYLLQIDNRQRINKDIHIFFYVFQLTFLKSDNIRNSEVDINYFFRFLCFELGIDNDIYEIFYISKNKLFFRSEKLGEVDFYNLIVEFYEKIEISKNKKAIANTKLFQLSVIDFLFSNNYKMKEIPINDFNKKLINPDCFLLNYKNSAKVIFNSLVDCFNKHQSGGNLLISNMILMNYSYYILKNNKRSVFSLKKHVNNDVIFSSILSSLAFRRIIVDKDYFIGMGLAEYLSLPDGEESILYNLIYSI